MEAKTVTRLKSDELPFFLKILAGFLFSPLLQDPFSLSLISPSSVNMLRHGRAGRAGPHT